MNKKLQVVYIIDECSLAFNAGSSSGICEGQRYQLYSLSPTEIFDPNTKESLGYLEIVKGIGKVTNVQEKMSILVSDEDKTYTQKIIRKHSLYSPLLDNTEEITSYKEKIPFDNPQEGDFLKRIN